MLTNPLRCKSEDFLTGKKKIGRPRALQPDLRTLATLRGLGRIQATIRECAAVLGVSHQTFIAFCRRHPEAAEIMEQGREMGRQSLRRVQFKTAHDGNATMQIWLGKQYLGQTDKQEIAQTTHITVTDARSKLEHIVTRQAAALPSPEGAGKPH